MCWPRISGGLFGHQNDSPAAGCSGQTPGRIPGDRALAVLALFNENILQEAAALRLPMVDLRSMCLDNIDYSRVSPIDPSGTGAMKISNVIGNMLDRHDFKAGYSMIYL